MKTFSSFLFACLSVSIAESVPAQVTVWDELVLAGVPTARQGSAMAYDRARDRIVVFAGINAGLGAVHETLEHDGSAWTSLPGVGPVANPAQGRCVEAVYDRVSQRTLAVYGHSPNGTTQVLEWDGANWTSLMLGSTPPGRFGFGLSYDNGRNVTVMFGGRSGAAGDLSDTWEWHGSGWQLRGTGGPSPRLGHAMAYDEARGVTLLFGGHSASNNQQLGDTWEWNGTFWLQRLVPGPPARSYHNMVYDELRQRVVLHGGRALYGGGGVYDQVWEWDGTGWQMTAASTPGGFESSMTYDSLRGRVVLFGGDDPFGGAFNGSWVYTRTGNVASIQSYGAGCPGPAGTPDLHAVGGSRPVLGSTLDVRIDNLPTGLLNLAFGWIGFDNTSWNGVPLPVDLTPAGFPGCSALLAPGGAYSIPNSGGFASWSLDVPFEPVFAGASFYLQGGVLVLGFNPGGVVFSNGLAGTIGG